MPISDFEGNTFVAFIDIIGFKSMMNNTTRAIRALDIFYNTGYRTLGHGNVRGRIVNGLFISDCGVLFARMNRNAQIKTTFEELLNVVSEIHRRCFRETVQLSSSIAWGEFIYHGRIEFMGIEKNPIYGGAYISAYLDNSSQECKIYANDCRIIKDGLPEEITEYCQHDRKIREEESHFYFEWMRHGNI